MSLLLIKAVQSMTKAMSRTALITKNFKGRTEKKGQFLHGVLS